MSDNKGHSEAYVRKVTAANREYVRELLQDNEKLRGSVVRLERQCEDLARRAEALRSELDRHLVDEGRLQQNITAVEQENREHTQRYLEVEQQNSNLANLYVASYRLHSTLDRQEVIATIQEILANLVGSEEIGLFESDSAGRGLDLIASVGIDEQQYKRIVFGAGRLGQLAARGRIYVANPSEPDRDEERLSACVPLIVDGRVTGCIAIFGLLPQKGPLNELDRELFELLATHSATALYCTRLYAEHRDRAVPITGARSA